MMLVVIPLALFGDLKKAYHYFKKKIITRNAVKVRSCSSTCRRA
jgi:hypothetical protein